MSYSLDEFNTEFGDEDYKPDEKKSFFLPEQQYHMQVIGQTVTDSKWGTKQLETLNTRVLENGDTFGSIKQWLELPIYTKEKEQSLSDEEVKKYRQIARNNLLQWLQAVDNVNYQLYAQFETRNGKKVYYDATGRQLSNTDFTDRKIELNKAVFEYAKATLVGTARLYVGAQYYYVEVPRPNKPGYVYKNYSPVPFTKYPLAEDKA